MVIEIVLLCVLLSNMKIDKDKDMRSLIKILWVFIIIDKIIFFF